MATQAFGDSNLIDAETVNWRLIVYPVLAAIVLIMGGFIYYYYLQNQREQLEIQAREALVQATTPEAMVQVADQFPHTDQATLALLSAANASFAKKDFDAAIRDYQRIIGTADANAVLRDSAQMGVGSTLEASGKADDAIKAYLTVAQRGSATPYAPAAYNAIAQIYQQRGDKTNEQNTLVAEAALDPDSPFVQQAQFRLKALNAAASTPFASGTIEKK